MTKETVEQPTSDKEIDNKKIGAGIVGVVFGGPIFLFIVLLLGIILLTSACIGLGFIGSAVLTALPSSSDDDRRPTRPVQPTSVPEATVFAQPLPESSSSVLVNITPYAKFTLSPDEAYLVAWHTTTEETGLLWHSFADGETRRFLSNEQFGELVWLDDETVLVGRFDFNTYWLMSPAGISPLDIYFADQVDHTDLLAWQDDHVPAYQYGVHVIFPDPSIMVKGWPSNLTMPDITSYVPPELAVRPIKKWAEDRPQPNPAGTYTATLNSDQQIIVQDMTNNQINVTDREAYFPSEYTHCTLHPFRWANDTTIWFRLSCTVNGNKRQLIIAWVVNKP